MGTMDAFVDMQPRGDVRYVRGFNGALQSVEGRGTVALQGEARKQVLVPDVLYVPGDVLGQARYSGRILCTNLRPCLTKSTMTSTEVVALWTIASATKSAPNMLYARLAHVGVDTIKSSVKHDDAASLDIKKLTAADLPCASYVVGKLARHTFHDKGAEAENALDGSLCFLLLKVRKTRYVWVRPIAKKSDVLVVFEKWLKEVERLMSKTVKKLRSGRRGDFLGRTFTNLVEDKGILHNLTCPYTPQHNWMAEWEMRTVVKAAEYGPALMRTPSAPPWDFSSEMPPLLVIVDEHDDEDVKEVPLPPPVVPSSAAVDEGRLGASLAALTCCIAGGRRDAEKVSDCKRQTTGEVSATKPTSATP
ncbi:unnamed protein product [Closterium sp. NIES-54]